MLSQGGLRGQSVPTSFSVEQLLEPAPNIMAVWAFSPSKIYHKYHTSEPNCMLIINHWSHQNTVIAASHSVGSEHSTLLKTDPLV